MGLVINYAPFAWNCKYEILLGILLCCALLFSLYLFLWYFFSLEVLISLFMLMPIGFMNCNTGDECLKLQGICFPLLSLCVYGKINRSYNFYCWLKFFNIFWSVEAGAREEKDNIWRAAQEEVWNARRLWMGRRVTGMARGRLYHPVAWRLWLQSLSSRQNAILLLFLGGFQKLIALVIIYDYPKFSFVLVVHGACPYIGTLVGLNSFITLTCFLIFLLQGKLAKRFILTTRCGLVGITCILMQ